ncbi:unnamed protein product, partial [Nesidiocoris tenuis]
ASTEFTGWPSSSTTPISIEKILEKARQDSAKILEYNRLATSTDAPSTREAITSTARTTTTRAPTTPGICEKDCDMAATLRLVGGAKWVPELLDHNTLEWQQLANEVETQLVNRHKSAKKKQPTVLTEDMISELNKNHMGGLDNFGADDLYNMEDVWADKPVAKVRRSSGSIQENSMANLYDSWRSEWNGYYYNAYYGNGK